MRLQLALNPSDIEDTACCYAEKTDPDGAPWEWYVKTADADRFDSIVRTAESDDSCCAPEPAAAVATSCC